MAEADLAHSLAPALISIYIIVASVRFTSSRKAMLRLINNLAAGKVACSWASAAAGSTHAK
jgi:hypothetical protein